VAFTVWDVGGQEKLRPLWKMYLSNSDALVIITQILKFSISFLPF
jgi:Arf/Sar family protein